MLHDKCKILLVKHVGCWHPFIILPIFIGLKTKQQIAKTEGKKTTEEKNELQEELCQAYIQFKIDKNKKKERAKK